MYEVDNDVVIYCKDNNTYSKITNLLFDNDFKWSQKFIDADHGIYIRDDGSVSSRFWYSHITVLRDKTIMAYFIDAGPKKKKSGINAEAWIKMQIRKQKIRKIYHEKI